MKAGDQTSECTGLDELIESRLPQQLAIATSPPASESGVINILTLLRGNEQKIGGLG